MSISWTNLISYVYTSQPNDQIPALLFTSSQIGYVCGIEGINITNAANLYGVATVVGTPDNSSVNVSYKNLSAPASTPWNVNNFPSANRSTLLASMPTAIYSNNGTYVYLLSLNSSGIIQNVTAAYQISGPPGTAVFSSIPTCVAGVVNQFPQATPAPVPPAKLSTWADVAQFISLLPVGLLPWVIFTNSTVPDKCNITNVYQQTQQLFNTSPTNFLANNSVNSIYVTTILTRNTPISPVQGLTVNISGRHTR